MKKEDIEKELKSVADDFNSDTIKKQKSINNNLHKIEDIKSAGVTYAMICEILNSMLSQELEYTYFKSMLLRAKRNAEKTTISNIEKRKEKQQEENNNSVKGFFSQREEKRKVDHDASASLAKFEEKYK